VYASYFGLKEPPFSITPDPRYVYLGDRHREALAHLLYGIGEGGGFVQLTGEVGTGKTTLCRTLIEQLPPDVDVALVLNPTVTAVELLATMCDELRISYPPGTASLKVLVDALYRHLLDAHARGRRTVLVVDEAQNLSLQVLEQIRLLTNLETATTKLLQIILIGQPELIALLDRPEARPVAQRITARYHLLPLSAPETGAYIRHRIEVAGRPDLLQPTEAIFSAPAMRQIHRVSGGVPRLINVVCDRALLGAYASDTDRVDAAMARRAAREVLGRGSRWMRAWWWIAAPVAAAAVIGGLWLFPPPGALEQLGRAAMPAVSRSPAAPPGSATSAPERSAPPTGSAPTAAAGIEPGAGSAAPAPPATRLADLLGDRSLPSDRASALAALYARWHPGETPGSTVGSGCESGRLAGLDCRTRTGTWTKLRRLNLPAVIELMGSDGERHYATLTGLDQDRATLEIGGKPFTFPLAEIDPLWDGAFIVLWKAPPVSLSLLGPGTRGKDVEWLSQRLRAIEGRPPEGRYRDVYDDELKARVMAFQRSRSLLPDGIVGEETLFQLTTAVPDPSRPLLSRPGRSE